MASLATSSSPTFFVPVSHTAKACIKGKTCSHPLGEGRGIRQAVKLSQQGQVRLVCEKETVVETGSWTDPWMFGAAIEPVVRLSAQLARQ